MRLIQNNYIKLYLYTFIAVFFIAFNAVAYAVPSMGGVATNVTGSLEILSRLMTTVSYMIGFGFAIGAIIKYKAHRDNPSQVTLGQPILLLLIALAFALMPILFLLISGKAIFGTAALVGGPTGKTSF